MTFTCGLRLFVTVQVTGVSPTVTSSDEPATSPAWSPVQSTNASNPAGTAVSPTFTVVPVFRLFENDCVSPAANACVNEPIFSVTAPFAASGSHALSTVTWPCLRVFVTTHDTLSP